MAFTTSSRMAAVSLGHMRRTTRLIIIHWGVGGVGVGGRRRVQWVGLPSAAAAAERPREACRRCAAGGRPAAPRSACLGCSRASIPARHSSRSPRPRPSSRAAAPSLSQEKRGRPQDPNLSPPLRKTHPVIVRPARPLRGERQQLAHGLADIADRGRADVVVLVRCLREELVVLWAVAAEHGGAELRGAATGRRGAGAGPRSERAARDDGRGGRRSPGSGLAALTATPATVPNPAPISGPNTMAPCGREDGVAAVWARP
jgi:hypothetical protein